MRAAGFALLLGTVVSAQDRALDELYRGQVRHVRGRVVEIFYDFEKPEQLEDFDVTGGAELVGGRLVLPKGSSALHKLVAATRVTARATLFVQERSDCGFRLQAEKTEILLDLFDHRHRKHGGLLLARLPRGAEATENTFRTIAWAHPPEAGRFLRPGKPVEVELDDRGTRLTCRVHTFHRVRKVEDAMPPRRFGLWADTGMLSVDELILTLDPAAGTVAISTDLALEDAAIGKLVKTAKERPLSVDAARARKELSRRGPDGWKRLNSIARHFLRKQAYSAIPFLTALGDGPEEKRREYLLKFARGKSNEDVRLAACHALLPWYPQDAELLHDGLRLHGRGRLAYFRELLRVDVPDDVLRGLSKDEKFAEEIYAVLKDRGLQLSGKELASVARLRAREALSPAATRAFLKEFKTDRNWAIIVGLIGLLQDEDKAVARGAHLLLLTLSGKDLPPDPDFWRSWLTAKKETYELPRSSAPGVVAACILRGVESLQQDMLEDGVCVWPGNTEWPGTRVGATALCVYALRAAGVPRNDPAIVKAVETTLLLVQGDSVAMRGDLDDYTYAYSMLGLALASVDGKRFQPQLTVIAKKIQLGQLENGQWTYRCHDPKYKRVAKAGDNSNTQYAILALRACRLAGVPVDNRVWEKNAGFWLHSINAWGGWGYGPRGTTEHELSMTSAGVATYAICMEALHGRDASRLVRTSKRVQVGMRRLGEILLVKAYKDEEIYAYYGVERACILTGTRLFAPRTDLRTGTKGKAFDWYDAGAKILVETQKESGAWGDPHSKGITTGNGYGEAIDTAYALLFLKRATTGLPGASGGGVVEVPYVRPKTVRVSK